VEGDTLAGSGQPADYDEIHGGRSLCLSHRQAGLADVVSDWAPYLLRRVHSVKLKSAGGAGYRHQPPRRSLAGTANQKMHQRVDSVF